VFWPALDAGFVSWDDDANFLLNPDYRGLGVAQLKWMWTTFHLGHWMPLSWMTLGLDYLLWGMEPRGYHLTNLLLHAAGAALLALLTARVVRLALGPDADERPNDVALAAGLAALLFAIHPLRVESVAWVTERRDVLSALLALTATWCYLSSVTDADRSRRWYLLALTAFAAGLLSKATVLTLPALFALLEVYPLRRVPADGGWFGAGSRRIAGRLAPFALLSLVSALVSVRALGHVDQLPPLGKVAVSAFSLAFYSLKTVVPTGLAPLYIMPLDVDPLELRYVAGLVASVVLTGAALAAWRRWPGVTVAWVAWVVALFPMLGLRQNGFQIAADRYTYHAAPVLTLLAGGLLLVALRRWRGLTVATGAVVVIALGAATWRQTTHWRDSEALWRRALETGNGGWIAHNNFGNAILARGLVREAEVEYRRAIALNPRYAEAHMDLGVALSQQGKDDEAEPALRRALELRPDYDDAMVNLGLVLSRRGAHDDAIALYARALILDRRDVNAEVNWGNALVRLRRPAEAIVRYERALALDPSQPQARANLEVARRMLAAPPASPDRR
jgi:Tfp pilus assembly protein PilF